MFSTYSKPRGLIVAAPRSGSGKTTVTLGLLRALSRRGLTVQPFKCGPDYIDPAFHEAACGRPSYNLDSWAMRKQTATALLRVAEGADFIVAEASMGLFDGVIVPGQWGNGASADIAAAAHLPAVLVLDISGQAQTAAAVARGFAGFRPNLEIAGVILNRAASSRHEKLARDGFERIGMPVFGAIPRKEAIALPERHLGLVQAGEVAQLAACLDALAGLAEAYLDIDALLKAPSPRPSSRWGEGTLETPCHSVERAQLLRPPGQRIALAQDAAFSFVYPHLLKAWREAGTEILPFSPLADETPDRSADAVWLPGGYPELHAGRLAANANFLAGVRAFAATKPVHGECGGYMVLGEGLIGAHGERHAMLGLLRLVTSFAARKLHLGYRRAELLTGCVLGLPGDRFAGHEFHYSSVLAEDGERLFALADAEASMPAGGLRNGTVTGSFLHIIDRWNPGEAPAPIHV
ncbi:MAG: cobyrinate a,c-diamide synthase [Rhodomicrobium sp.]